MNTKIFKYSFNYKGKIITVEKNIIEFSNEQNQIFIKNKSIRIESIF